MEKRSFRRCVPIWSSSRNKRLENYKAEKDTGRDTSGIGVFARERATLSRGAFQALQKAKQAGGSPRAVSGEIHFVRKGRLQMADWFERIAAFQKTLRKIKEIPELASRTLQMQAGTMLYLREYRAVNPTVKSRVPDVRVLEDTTFHAASRYAGGEARVAVLNFANAYTPGGSVKEGAMAQEECLCRSSNLYAALTLPYLLKNYYKWNDRNTGEMGSDAVIYSPVVTVFRSDEEIPQDLGNWFAVDVLSCAAPYYNPDRKKPVSPEKLRQVFTERIRNILEVAAARDADILVLGAFGCGAFHNPPELVADVFRQLLIDDNYAAYFRKVIFAIPGGEGKDRNFTVFREFFPGEE